MSAERPKLSNFIVLLSGQIDSAEFPSFDNFYCKYTYVYGADWEQVGGVHEGLSSRCGRGRTGSTTITVGMPIEATFSSTSSFGWPQVVLTCYGSDFFGNDVIRGYGAVHIPTVSGRTVRRIPIFVPEASTPLQRFFGWITGKRAEFVDPRIAAKADGRQVTKVRSQGIITIAMDIVLKDMKKYGYDVVPSSIQKISECPLPNFTRTFSDHRQVQPGAAVTDSGAESNRAISEPEPQSGSSNVLSITARAAPPPQVRPLPMPRQRPRTHADIAEVGKRPTTSDKNES